MERIESKAVALEGDIEMIGLAAEPDRDKLLAGNRALAAGQREVIAHFLRG